MNIVNIVAKYGNDSYVGVTEEDNYALINIVNKTMLGPYPIPDIFYKHGYFEDMPTSEITITLLNELTIIAKHIIESRSELETKKYKMTCEQLKALKMRISNTDK